MLTVAAGDALAAPAAAGGAGRLRLAQRHPARRRPRRPGARGALAPVADAGGRAALAGARPDARRRRRSADEPGPAAGPHLAARARAPARSRVVELVEGVTRHLLRWTSRWLEGGLDPVRAAWNLRCFRRGEPARSSAWPTGGSPGRIAGLDAAGAFVVGERRAGPRARPSACCAESMPRRPSGFLAQLRLAPARPPRRRPAPGHARFPARLPAAAGAAAGRGILRGRARAARGPARGAATIRSRRWPCCASKDPDARENYEVYRPLSRPAPGRSATLEDAYLDLALGNAGRHPAPVRRASGARHPARHPRRLRRRPAPARRRVPVPRPERHHPGRRHPAGRQPTPCRCMPAPAASAAWASSWSRPRRRSARSSWTCWARPMPPTTSRAATGSTPCSTSASPGPGLDALCRVLEAWVRHFLAHRGRASSRCSRCATSTGAGMSAWTPRRRALLNDLYAGDEVERGRGRLACSRCSGWRSRIPSWCAWTCAAGRSTWAWRRTRRASCG